MKFLFEVTPINGYSLKTLKSTNFFLQGLQLLSCDLTFRYISPRCADLCFEFRFFANHCLFFLYQNYRDNKIRKKLHARVKLCTYQKMQRLLLALVNQEAFHPKVTISPFSDQNIRLIDDIYHLFFGRLWHI